MHIFEDLFEKEQLFTSQVRFDFYHIGFLHLFFFFFTFFSEIDKVIFNFRQQFYKMFAETKYMETRHLNGLEIIWSCIIRI